MDLVMRCAIVLVVLMVAAFPLLSSAQAEDLPAFDEDLQIEITPKDIGKQVVISQGTKEWFMLIEVTPDNSAAVRQEKDGDEYLVDDLETHDRPMTQGEVDAAITDYIHNVQARVKKRSCDAAGSQVCDFRP